MANQKAKFNIFRMHADGAEQASVVASINEEGNLIGEDDAVVTADTLFESVSEATPISAKVKGYIVSAANVAAALLIHTPNNGHIRWTPDEVRAMRAERAAGASYKGLSKKYGGSVAGVRNLCLGNTRGDIPFEPGTTPDEVAANIASAKAEKAVAKAEAEAAKARELAAKAKASAN